MESRGMRGARGQAEGYWEALEGLEQKRPSLSLIGKSLSLLWAESSTGGWVEVGLLVRVVRMRLCSGLMVMVDREQGLAGGFEGGTSGFAGI
jgi:hypothetical protein